MIGETLAHFRITAKLGEGGMGVVYRAEDTRLGREVAIKVLPPAFTRDTERLARFEREAKVLASLNHSSVAAIYEVGAAGGTHFLAMELAHGEDLGARLGRAALPLPEAITIALEIAEGLEAAHERGIVHRDLKPGNVVVDPGTNCVKLLDFGLAKATEPAPEADPMSSPTLTAHMTQAGVILGTASYMSPEQARGKVVDKRTDIWAFGCILFEMLAGKRAFPGRDTSEILAAVIRGEPELDSLPDGVPVAMRRLIEHCLEKEPRQRLRDIGDARIALEEIRDRPAASAADTEGRGRAARVAPWAVAGVLAVISSVLVLWPMRAREEPAPVRRFAIDLPWHSVPNWTDFVAALSPTGEHIAYNGRAGNRVDVYVRALDSLEGHPLAQARESTSLAFSPDGHWLGLLNGTLLSKVPVRGGEPTKLADIQVARTYGLSWGPRDDLLIGAPGGLYRVSASGGQPERVTNLDEAAGDSEHTYPTHLPGGGAALFTINREEGAPRIAVVDLDSGAITQLPVEGTAAVYAASGHLIFRRRSTAMAVPFDLATLSVRGDPVPVLENVEMGPWVAADGTMLYIPARIDSNARLVWTDRSGRATPITEEPRDYSHLDLSSDGLTALLNIGAEVFALDLARGTRQLLRARGQRQRDSEWIQLFPIFTPDDREATTYRNARGIFLQPIDGSGDAQALVDENAMAPGDAGELLPRGVMVPTSWNPRTDELAFFDDSSDVWILQADGSVRPLLRSEANERTARFSPDGRWLAYVSDETDQYQVYVTGYPGPAGKLAVSIDGGLSPIWSADGRELFFRNGGKLMSAAVSYEPGITFGTPAELFDGPYTLDLMGHQRYDVAPDGKSFLMVENSDDFRLVLVQNWLAELERLPSD